MTSVGQNAQDVLRQEIIDDARRQAERVLRRARREAEELLGKAGGEAAAERERLLAQARAEAARRTGLVLARVPVESGRLRATRIEAVLQSLHDEARRRLEACAGVGERAALLALLAAAAGGMEGDDFVARLSPADRRTLGAEWLAELRRLTGKPALQVELGEELGAGQAGPLLRDREGRRCWDNRLPSRLARMWPALRIAVALHTGLLSSDP